MFHFITNMFHSTSACHHSNINTILLFVLINLFVSMLSQFYVRWFYPKQIDLITEEYRQIDRYKFVEYKDISSLQLIIFSL